MKILQRTVSFLVLALVSAIMVFSAEIERIEPANWWVGMNNPNLQVLVYGPNIARCDVSIDYPGVTLSEISKVENPNYLFLYFTIAPSVQPGTMRIEFKEGRKTTTKDFEFFPRNTKPGAMGFTTEDVLYLIMPDRFANGNPDNDVYDGIAVDRSRGGRHGGDLEGIEKHLGYIDSLGVTAIWLNPVQYNNSGASHGYSITDFYKIDPRLGTNEEYSRMVDAAHAKGIKVVMDMIFNHCGSGHWWIYDIPSSDWFNAPEYAKRLEQQHKDLVSGKITQEELRAQTRGRSGGRSGFEGRQEDGYLQTTHFKWTLMDPHAPQSEKDILLNGWFSRGMPDLNQKNRHLAAYLIQNSIWWIEYSRIDGIRMDTYPYADYDFMTRWCREIEDQYPDFSIVGEGWYPRNSAVAWWQKNSPVNERNTHLEIAMDFDLAFTAKKEFNNVSSHREGSEAGLFKLYEAVAQDFLFPDPDNVLVFLDNHDLPRFMGREDSLWRFKQGVAFLLTTRGIPQLYYGTEILMRDGGDNRADFPGGWIEDERNAFTAAGRTPEQNEGWNFISKLLQWRRTSEAAKTGKLVHYTPDATSCYVYAKIKGDDTVLVVINGSSQKRHLDMSRFTEVIGSNTKGIDVVSGQTVPVTGSLDVPARGVYVLELAQ
ncbi:MAG: glycoside hydrolase family 13 protein [Bacteroidota bacterium]|nr:glycoside hydrolase family 13 protein [Bacteroidota bacterium]